MQKRRGLTLIELMMAAFLIGSILAIGIPFTVALMSASARQPPHFRKLEVWQKIAENLRQDIRASSQIFTRDNGAGFVLEIPQKSSASPLYVAYNINETEPGVLYRSKFSADTTCTLERLVVNVKEWKVTVEQGPTPLVSVAMTLAVEGKNAKPVLPYVVTSCLRVAARKQ
jgi:prepilin-type N-terminal cleavage/methylation domain-containing protein